MPKTPPQLPSGYRNHWLLAGIMAGVAALVSACKSPVEPGSAPDKTLSKAPGNGGTDSATPTKAKSAPMLSPASTASTAKAYRKDAATHLYGVNSARIFKGPLPAHLYAIGVLEVDIDRSGQVQRLHWMRAPRHAPEVVLEIERTVRAAAPYPVPARLGKVTYTDTWLWDKSGHFQLDTLTEGQL